MENLALGMLNKHTLFTNICVKIEIEISQKERENMKFVAVIVAVLYIISMVFIALAAFLVSNTLGLLTCGLGFMIPSIVLYYEATKLEERG